MKLFNPHTDKHPDGSWTIGGSNLLDVFIGAMALFQGAGVSLFLIWFFAWTWFWKISWFFAGTILAAMFVLKYKIQVRDGNFRVEKLVLGIPYQAMDLQVDYWESNNANQIRLFPVDPNHPSLLIQLKTDEELNDTRWLVIEQGGQEMLFGHSEDSAEAIFRAITRAVRHVYAEKERTF
ncbi:MAG: hypothetical protein H6581_24725 [Bacteroidia bacterium]|nr:hypothetical protein [Bacteroidia bacterium]